MEMAPEIKQERWKVLWASQRSQRYHSRRSIFYDRWHKATAFVGVVGGSSVIASLGKIVPSWVALTATFIVVCMSGVDLVAGIGEMARKHNDLRRRYCELEADIAHELAPTEASIAAWKVKRLTIESDEPPAYVALDILCYNELARAYGRMADIAPQKLPLFKAITAQLFVWPNA